MEAPTRVQRLRTFGIVVGTILLIGLLVWRFTGISSQIDLSYYSSHESDVMSRLIEHLRLTVITLAIASAIAVPLGITVARLPFLYTPIMGLLGIIYTIPSLALLVMLVPIFGTGTTSALIALVAYAQFILVRNVIVGLREVDPAVIDAARGMGMNGWQILWKIEIPLALPVMLSGLRIATVATIAIATIADWISAGGLGRLLRDGLNEDYTSEILVGAIAVALLAIVADVVLRVVEYAIPTTRARSAQRR